MTTMLKTPIVNFEDILSVQQTLYEHISRNNGNRDNLFFFIISHFFTKYIRNIVQVLNWNDAELCMMHIGTMLSYDVHQHVYQQVMHTRKH